MSFFFKVSFMIVFFVGFSNVSASNLSLQKFVNQLHTFSADFEQIQPEEEFFQLNKAYGSFKLKRPGQLLWVYHKPEPQDIMVDGVNIWIFDRDLDQVTVRNLQDVKRDFPLSWLLFDEPIENRYRIIERDLVQGMQWFNLRPRESTFFQSLEVGMRDGKMVEIHMYQSMDHVTKVRFKNIVINEKIAESTFRFQVPEGIDLIGHPQRVN